MTSLGVSGSVVDAADGASAGHGAGHGRAAQPAVSTAHLAGPRGTR